MITITVYAFAAAQRKGATDTPLYSIMSENFLLVHELLSRITKFEVEKSPFWGIKNKIEILSTCISSVGN